jgi:hypothetical protein
VIAALFVATGGAYFGLPDVDPWDEARDARKYAGPWPVVAHPPCQRWGSRWWWAGRGKPRHTKGADGGCFISALTSVRQWGGVLEHPANSGAWRWHGLNSPPRCGGWVSADFHGGWTCCVEQGHYGHRARKATWLYAVGVQLPSLAWGRSSATGLVDHMSGDGRERSATTPQFRDLLISIARSAHALRLQQEAR